MGALLSYFKSLEKGAEVDVEILAALNSANRIMEDKRGFMNVGSCISKYNSVYLPWVERSISCWRISDDQDVMSTKFSGCYFARIWYLDRTKEAFHIHMGTDCKKNTDWNEYVDSRDDIREIKLFRPLIEGVDETWAIISVMGECYEIALSEVELVPNEQTGRFDYTRAIFDRIVLVQPETDEQIR